MDFESLIEDQFHLDLVSDQQVEDQEHWDVLMDKLDRDINMGIHDYLSKMNRRR